MRHYAINMGQITYSDVDELETRHEVIQVKRPVIAESWLDDFILAAWESVGGAFSFRNIGELAVTLFGAGEMIKMTKCSKRLGNMSVKMAARRADQEIPKSFQHPITLKPEGLATYEYTELSGVENVVVIKLAENPQLTNERLSIIRGIDLTAGWGHDWSPFKASIKLAGVINDDLANQDLLYGLYDCIPREITAQAGFIQTATKRQLLEP